MNLKNELSQYGIKSVYHFTDIENLPTIQKYGIQSLKNIFDRNIAVKHFGAEELSHRLDAEKGLDQYVHLSFLPDHPMYYIAKARGSIKDPIWIEIDISVLFNEKTLFCNKVANQTNANIFYIDDIMKFIDFNALVNSEDFDIRNQARKAEILVYNSISTDKIKGVYYGKKGK